MEKSIRYWLHHSGDDCERLTNDVVVVVDVDNDSAAASARERGKALLDLLRAARHKSFSVFSGVALDK